MIRKSLAVLALLALAAPVLADERIDTYITYLSAQDHFNSSGTRLTSGAQILSQDRANIHRFNKGDDGDEWDVFFTSLEHRQQVPDMVRRGGVSAALLQDLVRFELQVLVEIWAAQTVLICA